MFTAIPDESVEVRRESKFILKRFSPDINELAWCTLRHLYPIGHSPGSDSQIEQAFRFFMSRPICLDSDHAFVNPAYAVTADRPTKSFVKAARNAQRAWFRQFTDMLQGCGRAKREAKRMSPIIRQLTFTGVLVINRKHVLPDRWPGGDDNQRKRNLVGHRFGRLVVTAMISNGRCTCQCECGDYTTVRRQHLVSGKTTSCGCRSSELLGKQRSGRRSRTG